MLDPIDLLSLPFHDETTFPDHGQMMIHRITGEVMLSQHFKGFDVCIVCDVDNSNKVICARANWNRCVRKNRILKTVAQ